MTVLQTIAVFQSSTLAQVRTLFPVLVIYFTLGMGAGWGSSGLFKLKNQTRDVPFTVSADEVSWIASVTEIGILTGAVLAGLIFNRIGRRYSILLVPVTLVIWSVLTFFARGADSLYVARFAVGMSQSINYVCSPIYIAEVSSPEVRGPLSFVGAFLFMSGSVVEFAVGPSADWGTQNLVGIPPAVLALLLGFCLMDESPYFLAMKGRYDDMTSVLMKVRAASSEDSVQSEGASIQADVTVQMQNATSLKKVFAEPGTRRAAIIVLTMQVLLSISGNTAMVTYGQIVFKETGSALPDDMSVIVMFGAQLVGLAISFKLVNSVGRRPLQSCTLLSCGACLTGTTIFLFVKEVLDVDVSTAEWVPLFLLILYRLSSGLGAYILPEILAGELLDQRTKTLVSPVGLILYSVLSFVVSNLFVRLQDSVGMYVIFFIFSVVNLFGGVFCAIMVPETKGKTLVEVQEMLRGRTHKGT